MSDDKKIVELDFKKPDRRMGVKKNQGKGYCCSHREVLADEENKVLECARCGFILTPWEYVWRLANSEERIYRSLEYGKKEKEKLDKELFDLKRQIRNAKAQARRLQGKND